MNSNLKRRAFLKNTLLATGGVILVPNFISCSDDDLPASIKIPENLKTENFDWGVASFDPTANQVIIWTRYATTAPSASIIWQLSTDSNFDTILREGEVVVDQSRDFTAAIEVKDLESSQKLFYRFINSEDVAVSPVGQTITLAATGNEAVSFAVVSCANYPAGLFNVYKEVANSDVDIVIHLGDYIYEYAPDQYGTNENTVALNRVPEPNREIVSLDDYRTRYRQYRSDADLKLAHQLKPFIAVWDDHEITNDTYIDGAQNHQSDEGSFEVRKQAALQAYSEFMPAMTNDISIIYRSFKIGDLADLIMLDTRLVGRDKQLEIFDYVDASGAIDAIRFQNDLTDTSRTMLGAQQLSWFKNQMTSSSSKYQIIGQQVLMGRMMVPAELLLILGQILGEVAALGTVTASTQAQFEGSLMQLTQLKARLLANDSTLTAAERARITTLIPYNLDAWDGYAAEREQLLALFEDKNVVVLAGDTHNAWHNEIYNAAGKKVATEFATSSVSSPGFETYLGTSPEQLGSFQQALVVLIDGLQNFDASQRGYLKVAVNDSGVNASWFFINTLENPNYSVTAGFTASL